MAFVQGSTDKLTGAEICWVLKGGEVLELLDGVTWGDNLNRSMGVCIALVIGVDLDVVGAGVFQWLGYMTV